MQSQKRDQSLIFQEDRLLVNLKVCIGLSQVVHFCDHKFVCPGADLVLHLLHLGLDLLQRLGVLSHSCGWILNVKNDFIQFFNFL